MVILKTKPMYLDNASTTKVDSRVLDEMIPFFSEIYGNASSSHEFGKLAKKAIEKSRIQVADLINCNEKEIIFTSGATEAINLAIKGFVEANTEKGNHIITVKTEHKAVLNTCEYLETKGVEVTYLDVDKNGLISIEDLEKAITNQTLMVAIMWVNNETGIIQNIEKIAQLTQEKGIVFFTDATQAVGKVPVDFCNSNVDMLCFSGHKINGPKGIGALIKKREVKITPLIHGGGQENGLRGGTYNTPLIVGLGKACELAKIEFSQNRQALLSKRKDLERYFEEHNIGKVNFRGVESSPHILSITLNDFEADEYLMMKSKEFLASTGSACNAALIEQSHVLRAINFPENKVLRLSISSVTNA